MSLDIRDDNLRLIYSNQERDHIDSELAYHRWSMFYAISTAIGFGIYVMVMPLLLMIFPSFEFFLQIGAFIWALFTFGAILLFIPILLQIRKYRKLRLEHQKFRERYGR